MANSFIHALVNFGLCTAMLEQEQEKPSPTPDEQPCTKIINALNVTFNMMQSKHHRSPGNCETLTGRLDRPWKQCSNAVSTVDGSNIPTWFCCFCFIQEGTSVKPFSFHLNVSVWIYSEKNCN